jgi:iron complex outermembrane receptor protein
MFGTQAIAADPPPSTSKDSDSAVTLPPVSDYNITVIGHAGSLTSPSLNQATQKKKEVPGAYSIQGVGPMYRGRVSNMNDLFQNAPGLVMLSENEVEVSKVFIRGSGVYSEDEPVGVQYLIDGLTLNQADGEMILEDLDMSTFKYSEVYRGADALQYGALGLGGAINFVPRTGYDAPAGQVRLEAGSFGFLRGQASSGGVQGPFDYYVSISGRSSEGYREHSEESTELLFGDFGYKMSSTLENRLYLIADQTDRQLPGALSQQQMDSNSRQAEPAAIAENFRKDWQYVRLADNLAYKSDSTEAAAGVYWWHRNAYEPNLYIPDAYYQGIGTFYADDFGASFNGSTRCDFLGGRNIVTAGFTPTAERESDAYYANDSGQQGAPTGQDIEWSLNAVLYGQIQHYLTKKLSLVMGMQAAWVDRNFNDGFTNTIPQDLNQSSNLVFRTLNPKIGLLYELSDKDQLFANFSRTWQPPSFDDMVEFDNGPNTSQTFTPLLPQKAWTAEAGGRGEDGRFKWEVSLYHSWMYDELLDEYNPKTDAEIGGVNIARSYNQGVEAGLDIRLPGSIFVRENKAHFGDSLTLRQNYTLSDLHFYNDPFFGYNRIAGVPVHDYEAQLLYETPGGFYAGPNLHWSITRYPVDNSNTLYAPAYALIGIKTGVQLGKRISIFVEAKNLLNELYASTADPISDNIANGGTASRSALVFHPGNPRSYYSGVSFSW